MTPKHENKEQRTKNKEGIKTLLSSYECGLEIPLVQCTRYVKLGDIVCMQSDSQYTNFYLQDGEVICSAYSLKLYAEQISEDIFYRSHRSYLVNLSAIKSLDLKCGSVIILSNGMEARIAKSKMRAFQLQMRAFIRRSNQLISG